MSYFLGIATKAISNLVIIGMDLILYTLQIHSIIFANKSASHFEIFLLGGTTFCVFSNYCHPNKLPNQMLNYFPNIPL